MYADGSEVMSVAFGETITQPNTVFMVVRPTAWDQNLTMIHDGISSSLRNTTYFDTLSHSIRGYAGTTYSPGVNATAGNNYYITTTFDGINSIIRINGVEFTGNMNTQSLSGLTIFGDFNAADNATNMVGYIMELIIYNGTESPTVNEVGLIAKWGI